MERAAMRRTRIPAVLLVGLFVLLGACAPSSTGPTSAATGMGGQPSGQGAANPTTPAAPKILRIALTREPDGFVISLAPTNSTSGGATQAQNIPANKLQNTDEKGQIYAELAMALPSTTDGTWTINPDGTMETTWKLRPNIKWHDGQPVTADDLVFGFQAATAPGVPSLGAAYLRTITDVVALDPLTAVVHWSKPNPQADAPGDNL